MFNGSVLIYITSMSMDQYYVLKVEGFDCPPPNVIITNFGTCIYNLNKRTGEFEVDVPYLV
jgi:hypothetical protein